MRAISKTLASSLTVIDQQMVGRHFRSISRHFADSVYFLLHRFLLNAHPFFLISAHSLYYVLRSFLFLASVRQLTLQAHIRSDLE